MLASHFARDKLLEGRSLEDSATIQRSPLHEKTTLVGPLKPETTTPLEKTSADSPVSAEMSNSANKPQPF